MENPQRARGKSSTSVRNAVAVMRAYFVAPDKRDARDVFMMRVVTRILDVRNIEMNGQRAFMPRVYTLLRKNLYYFFRLTVMIRNLSYYQVLD